LDRIAQLERETPARHPRKVPAGLARGRFEVGAGPPTELEDLETLRDQHPRWRVLRDRQAIGLELEIAIVDDGIDQTHPFFAPAGYTYPSGFPKGQTAYTTPKVIVARAFAPATPAYANAKLPFDPDLSDHGIHVAGIAAGNNNTPTRTGLRLSGIAPRAYLGNYKALGIPSQFGANGNSPELAAAIEMAVKDGMDVINLSLGETEIEPSRDVVARALNAAADAGVVSAVSTGNDFGEFGFGSITSPANAAKVISVAASSGGHGSPDVDNVADFSSAGPTPYSLTFKPDVTAPGEGVASAAPGGGFVEISGTSMSAPHVAGAAAVLRQRHPTWTPAQIKSALVLTGVPVHNGGTAEINGAVTTIQHDGGELTVWAGGVTTLTIDSGIVHYNSTGTLATVLRLMRRCDSSRRNVSVSTLFDTSPTRSCSRLRRNGPSLSAYNTSRAQRPEISFASGRTTAGAHAAQANGRCVPRAG